MKYSILIFIGAAMLLAACKKDHVTKNPALVTGTWELRATKGGNILPSQYTAGNGHLITFQVNSYIDYSAGSVVTQGNLLQHADSNGNIAISFSSGDFQSESGLFQNDTLRLKPFNPDAATSYYVKTQ